MADEKQSGGKKVSASDFMAKYGNVVRKVVTEHGDKPATAFGGRLPGGITQGVAKFDQCYFGTGEKGDYWRAVGIVEAPETHNGIGIRGLQTSLIVGISAENIEQAFIDIQNEMKLLIGDKLFANKSNINLVEISEMMTKRARDATQRPIYFRFSTSEGKVTEKYPNPKVFENWHGSKGLENWTPPVATTPNSGIKDETGKNTTTTAATTTAPTSPPPPPPPVATPQPESQTAVEYRDDEDLDSLSTRAANGDQVADGKLRELAAKLGYTDDDCNDATSWDVVVGWIKKGEPKEGSDGDTEGNTDNVTAAEFVPVAGETACKYAPPDPKSKAGARLKAIDCEVIDVQPRKKTMTLRSLADKKKKWEGVAWVDAGVKYDS